MINNRVNKGYTDDLLSSGAQQGKDALVQDDAKCSLSSEIKVNDLQFEWKSSGTSSGQFINNTGIVEANLFHDKVCFLIKSGRLGFLLKVD